MIKKFSPVLSMVLVCYSAHCSAGDLSADVRSGARSPEGADGNYFELGAGIDFSNEPVYGIPEGNSEGNMEANPELDMKLRLQYKGFFGEYFTHSQEKASLGYIVTNTENWSFDLIGSQQHPEISSSESKNLEGLSARHRDFMGGLRSTGYLDNYIIQIHALTDISGTHGGQVFSVKVARDWQLRNLNFHAILGTSYRSDKVADYYLSVGPEDQIEGFPKFSAHRGFINIIETGVTYPISQKWVLRGLYRHIDLDSDWRSSPVLVTNHLNTFKISISHVFF